MMRRVFIPIVFFCFCTISSAEELVIKVTEIQYQTPSLMPSFTEVEIDTGIPLENITSVSARIWGKTSIRDCGSAMLAWLDRDGEEGFDYCILTNSDGESNSCVFGSAPLVVNEFDLTFGFGLCKCETEFGRISCHTHQQTDFSFLEDGQGSLWLTGVYKYLGPDQYCGKSYPLADSLSVTIEYDGEVATKNEIWGSIKSQYR